jgi:ADP-ribose pyrophosphatase YjhB (NUDIX family)
MPGDPPNSVTEFLDELRGIAQMGLHYAQDPYDRERYERLLALASVRYAELSGLPAETVMERFRSELGHVTPKVGVDAAVFSPEGRILLVRRSDDGLWCLPCGWADLGETPRAAIEREVREETGLETRAEEVIDVFARLPGDYGDPHAVYAILFHCRLLGGEIRPSPETPELGFYDPKEIVAWHKGHGERARAAWERRHRLRRDDGR